MPSKKGRKSNKLARMSDEERARYIQYRAELELETKRRKQQLIAIFSKNKLKHEEVFSRLNTAKINEQWRFILRQIKCKDLHEDVEFIWKNFDRMIKTKETIIQLLYGELKVTDLDHRRLQEAHMEVIDKIIERHKRRLAFIHEYHIREIYDIQQREVIDLKQLRENIAKTCRQLELSIFNQEKILNDTLVKIQSQHAVNIHSIVYLKEDMIFRLIRDVSNEMEYLWRQINEILEKYEEETEDKRKQYEYLKEQDDIHCVEIQQYLKLYKQLPNTIESLKSDTENLSQRRGNSIAKLKDQLCQAKKIMSKIRQEFAVGRTTDSAQLMKLSVACNGVIKDLKRISEKGSTLYQLIDLCTVLEPIYLSIKKYSLYAEETEEKPPCIFKPFDKLEKFWEQFNCIKADNISMKRKLDGLSMENKLLRHSLRTYLITVSRTSTLQSFAPIAIN